MQVYFESAKHTVNTMFYKHLRELTLKIAGKYSNVVGKDIQGV
jgi:hypothetical protein